MTSLRLHRVGWVLFVLVSAFSLAHVGGGLAADLKGRDNKSFSEAALLGKWMGHRDVFEYFADHTFVYDNNRNSGMKWSLDKNTLVHNFPDLPPEQVNAAYSGGITITDTILSLDKDKLVGLAKDGYRFVEYRLREDTGSARDAIAMRATAEEAKLNTIPVPTMKLRYGEPVALSGTITMEPMPSDIAPQEKDRQAWILHLRTPFSVDSSDFGGDPSESHPHVSEVHLLTNTEQRNVPPAAFGKIEFEVTGQLFPRNTANHARPVVMSVDALSPAANAKVERQASNHETGPSKPAGRYKLGTESNNTVKLRYAEPVALSGTIVTEPTPGYIGPRNTISEAWILRLRSPISTDSSDFGGNPSDSYNRVTEIHLLTQPEQRSIPSSAFGKDVFTVTGQLFPRNTASQARPVVMSVDSLSPAADAKIEQQPAGTSTTEANGVALRRKIVGRWQGTRHVDYFKEDGTFCLDPRSRADEDDCNSGKWEVRGRDLVEQFSGQAIEVVSHIVKLTASELDLESNNKRYVLHRVR